MVECRKIVGFTPEMDLLEELQISHESNKLITLLLEYLKESKCYFRTNNLTRIILFELSLREDDFLYLELKKVLPYRLSQVIRKLRDLKFVDLYNKKTWKIVREITISPEDLQNQFTSFTSQEES